MIQILTKANIKKECNHIPFNAISIHDIDISKQLMNTSHLIIILDCDSMLDITTNIKYTILKARGTPIDKDILITTKNVLNDIINTRYSSF